MRIFHLNIKGWVLKVLLVSCFSLSLSTLAFVLGVGYAKSKIVDEGRKGKNLASITPTPTIAMEGEPEDLISRCGEIPEGIMENYSEHFSVLSGPRWSPDCRHVAWGVWFSGGGWLDEGVDFPPPRLPAPIEGVYLYNDATKKIVKIYQPQKANEIIEFQKWGNRFTILFKVDDKNYSYDLIAKRLQLPNE